MGVALRLLCWSLIYWHCENQAAHVEGVVVNMYSKEEYVHRDRPETYTEYTTVIRGYRQNKEDHGKGQSAAYVRLSLRWR